MNRNVHRSLAVVVSLFLAACSKTAEPEGAAATASPVTPPAASPSAPPAATTTTTAAAAGALAWDAPAAWTSAPNPSPMRKATYKVPKAPGDPEDGELSVTQAGGSVEANVKRWSGQFDGAPDLKVSTRNVGSLKVTIVEGHGPFTGGGMPGAASSPRPNWALLGAIVDSTSPPYFFKLTGPEKTLAKARDDFDKFVGSLRAQ